MRKFRIDVKGVAVVSAETEEEAREKVEKGFEFWIPGDDIEIKVRPED